MPVVDTVLVPSTVLVSFVLRFCERFIARDLKILVNKNSSFLDFCSELEEVYEQLTRWMEEPLKDSNKASGDERDARDRAVVTFAGSLLKRALSESFAGVPVQEGEPQPLFDANDQHQKNKLALAVRSLSLELARQKSRRQPSVSLKQNLTIRVE